MKTHAIADAGTMTTEQPEKMNKFDGRRVTVVGLARAGLACALLCRRHGAEVFVTDAKSAETLGEAISALGHNNIAYETGGHTARALEQCDLVVVSPGVSPEAPTLAEARSRGIPIISELEAPYLVSDVPVVAVTGSNGKTTTTSWLGEIYRTAGMAAEVAGNIGRPYADAVLEHPSAERYILEVSSFQLEAIDTFAPAVAVVLNITADHLDRHRTLDRYAQLKFRLFENQRSTDVAIKNIDDPYLRDRVLPGSGQRAGFSLRQAPEYGVWLEGEILSYRFRTGEGELMEAREIGLPGRHNLANAAAAAGVALADGIAPDAVRTALKNFQGVEHRLEFVTEIDGVRYINDSKATNPDSVRVALEAVPAPVILIMGGLDKGTDFTVLFDLIRAKVRRLICTGKAAELIAGSVTGATGIMIIREFENAVEAARKAARAGDSVLLSPGCASFDSFKNYEQRGRVFKNVVLGFRGDSA